VAASGTKIVCVVEPTSVTCAEPGGLSATLGMSGVVRVGKTSAANVAAASSHAKGHHLVGPNDGFFGSTTRLYCHVYVQSVRIMSCYKESTPKGGDKGSSGFDISNVSVVVFRFPEVGVRQDARTLKQP